MPLYKKQNHRGLISEVYFFQQANNFLVGG